MKPVVLALLLGLTLSGTTLMGQNAPTVDRGVMSPKGMDRINKEIRHEILLLPYYGVFDSLAYKVTPDGVVTLIGSVTRPTLKSDAENVVKKVEGVTKVDNQIKVLPPSSNDDQIRRAAFREIYSSPQLSKYAWESVQSIHIIVANGNITLEGTVDNQTDKDVAGIKAKGVPNSFSVTNNLRVVKP